MNYPDVFFTEEYQELFKETAFGGIPCQYVGGGIDYRFYKRSIEGTPYFDIVSPYGYSGPVQTEKPDMGLFHDYCVQNNIVAEFARLHPFIKNYLLMDSLHYEHKIFYVDLNEDYYHGFNDRCRWRIRKAVREGLSVDKDVDIEDFAFLYYRTMGKNNATEGYLFDKEFWMKLKTVSHFLRVQKDGRTCAVTSLLIHGDYAHYFLSASDYNFPGAVNLLLHESMKYSKEMGCKIFNLGGGIKEDDSLAEFKKSFTRLSLPFYTYRKIHLPEVYEGLCKEKGIDPQSTGFFPNYRRE